MRTRTLIALLLAALLLSCQSGTPGVSTAFDPLMRFPAAGTYAWDLDASTLPEDPRIEQLELGPIIQQVANEALAARSWREAQSGTPQFLLSYEVGVRSFISAERSASVASLSLSLVEHESQGRVWMGWTRADLNVALTSEQRVEGLRPILARMFESFPPSQPPSR